MATDLQAPPYETLVDDNIAQVSQKIRLGDLGRGALALACLVFGYVLLVSLLDLCLSSSDAWMPLAIRLAVFTAFLGGVGYLGTRVVSRSLTTVNPIYAARQLEGTIPGSKNSIINWLDLRNQALPQVIHQAVGMKAAKVVEDADPDLVTSPRDLWKLTAAACVLFIGLVVLFAIVPRQFGSLLARAFVPIRPSVDNPAVTIAILKPGVGDVVVPTNQRVEFLARIDGRFPPTNSPGAPALLYRYTTNDIPVRLPLEEDNLGQWGVRLSPDQLRTGLYWRIAAGDASSPEVQVKVRSQPFVTKVEAKYIYRPYRKLAPETVTMPNETLPQPRLFGHRGTDVILKARTNAPIKSGSLELDIQGVKKILPAELPESEPQTLVFRFGLEKSGTFRILFDSPGGETNLDRSPYRLDVLEDGAPFVDLVTPGKDLVAPANGTVLLGGLALDDFGVTGLTLMLQRKVNDAAVPLAPIPYVPKRPLKLDNETYPAIVNYVDVIELDELRSAKNQRIDLVAGDEITYWLEATDNYDFGRANVGKSKTFKITIQDGLQPTMQQKQERAQAEGEKDRNDKNQSDKHDQQNDQNNKGGGKDKDKDGPGNGGGDNQKDGPGNGSKDGPPKDNPKDNGNGQNSGSKEGGASQSGGDGNSSPEQQQKKALENDLSGPGSKISDALDRQNKKDNPPSSSDSPKNNADNNSGANEQAKQKTGNDPSPKQNPSDPNGNEKNNSNPNEANPSKGGKDNPSNPEDGKKKGPTGSGDNPDQKKDDGKGSGSGETKGGKEKSSPDKSGGDDPNKAKTGKIGEPSGEGKSVDKNGDPIAKGKGQTPEGGNAEKANGPSEGKTRPGTAKDGDPKQGAKGEGNSQAKGAGQKNPPAAPEKGIGKNPGEVDAGKNPPGNKADTTTIGKNKDTNESSKPPTKEDVEALKDLLKKGGPEADAAAKDIAKRAHDMKDSNLKKQIENTLRDAGQNEALKELNDENPEIAPPPQKEGAEPNPNQKAGKDDPNKTKGEEASAKTGPGGKGITDVLNKITPEEAFKRRMGNLQLDNIEELKKRVGPDVLKEANVSPEEWQRFLDNARKYQELTDRLRQKNDERFLRGGASKMGSQGVRQVEVNPSATQDSLGGAQAAPPFEFRDAQRQFTRKTKGP